jgi:hypothetical protein
MKEIYEFRIPEDLAPQLFNDSEGVRLGTSIRKVVVSTDDPRFERIGKIQQLMHETSDRSFFYGWEINREYDKQDLSSAQLFQLKISKVFESAGEECGTEYNECTACPFCGTGADQVSPLFLPENRIPKKVDISKTIAGEIVVSRRLASTLRSTGLGDNLKPIFSYLSANTRTHLQDWYQFIPPNNCLSICMPTTIGINPYDLDPLGQYRCKCNKLLGLNLLSEVWVKNSPTYTNEIGMMSSVQFTGVRRGLLRPERVLFLSPNARNKLISENVKGFTSDVAHFA